MSTKKTTTESQDHPLVLVRLEKEAQMRRRRYIVQMPGWRRPLVGYIFSVPLIGGTLLGVIWEERMLPHFYFSGGPLFLAAMLITLIWGVGPALFAALLSTLALIYLYIPPFGNFDFTNWESVLPILPFFISGFLMIIITAQRESARQHALFAEQKEQGRASELEATFEAMVDGVMVYDLHGHVLRTNAAARKLFVLDTRPVAKPKFSWRWWRKREQRPVLMLLDEQSQPFVKEQLSLARILSGEVQTSADVALRVQEGREVQLNVTSASVYNSVDRRVGAVCVFRDVTERRQLERRTHDALNALLKMAETIVQVTGEVPSASEPAVSVMEGNMPTTMGEVTRHLAKLTCSVLGCRRVGIIGVDTEKNMLRPMAVVGLTVEQERQWWADQQLYQYMGESSYSALVSRLYTNEVQMLDMAWPPFDDRPNPYGARTVLVASMFAAQQLVGMLVLDYADIVHKYTEEERALTRAVAKLAALVIERERLLQERAEARANEIALREANRRMDEFLGIASHELRTPLTAVKGNIQLAKRQLYKFIDGDGRYAEDLVTKLELVQELLSRAERQVRVQNRLVGDLLDVSRIQMNKIELNLEFCDLAALVREVVQDWGQTTLSRIIRLEVPTEETVPVMADADRIGQVVTNYLTNALKYSEADRPVEVALQVEGKVVRVSVHDQGPGLSEEEQQAIWERFHQVERITVQNGSGGGLGLGLYICKTIIELHHGQVGVQSAVGEGSTFWFTLPLARD